MKHIIKLLIITFSISSSCNHNQANNNSIVQNDSIKVVQKSIDSSTIWQLDYYPDSIFINRTIDFDPIWESNYAYNIQFLNDSCQFIGWHESWWNRLEKVNENEFKTKNDPPYQWELKFVSKDKLLMREMWYGDKETKISKYYPYHRVNKILTQDLLQRWIAKEIFAGTYKLLFSDTFNCEKTIILDDKFGVKGIKGITNYSIETEIDWDFSVENAFWLINKSNDSKKSFSFKFIGDTLFIKDYEIVSSEKYESDIAEITNTRIKLIKVK
jgi:hypothetical protein